MKLGRIILGGWLSITAGILPTVFADELTLTIIRPKFLTDWSSPRSLASSALANYVGTDYARSGHFSVGLSCSSLPPNKQILTGMIPKTKTTVYDESKDKELGLGVLLKGFSGRLRKSDEELEAFHTAYEDNRLIVVHIPTSTSRCDQMLLFLNDWIDHGSFSVYGGGQNAEQGQGAGCSDFANEFFKIATGYSMPRNWMARVRIPESLIGSSQHPVSSTDVWINGDRWALHEEPHVNFQISDPALAYAAMTRRKTNQYRKHEYYFLDHLYSGEIVSATGSDPMEFYLKLASELSEVPRKPFVFTPRAVTQVEKDEILGNITTDRIYFDYGNKFQPEPIHSPAL